MKAIQYILRSAVVTLTIWMLLPPGGALIGAAETKVKDLPKEAVKALYLGQQAFQEKKFDEAVKVLSDYMDRAEEPVPLPAFQMLGHALYQSGDKENAREIYKKGYIAFPENAEMLQNFTILTYETDRYDEAARLFEKLYRLKGSTDKNLLYQAAGIFFHAENLGDAKRVLTELLTAEGEPEPKWYEDMIAICVETGQWNDAEKWSRTLLARNPDQPKYWRLLAQMRLDREEYKSAASALEIAYRLEDAEPAQWLDLADLYRYLNAPLMAIRCMDAAYQEEIPADKKAKMASLYARTLRFDQGIAYLDQAFRKAPSAALLLGKGRMLYDAMNYEKAIATLEACADMDPTLGEASILAGFAAWNIKDFQRARSFFARASILPKYREQANDAINVLDDLMAAMSETKNQ